MRLYWSDGAHDTSHRLPHASAEPHTWAGPHWIDDVVVGRDRAGIRHVLEQFASVASDELRIHSFAVRAPGGHDVRPLRLAGRRDTAVPGPDVWLRGVTTPLGTAHPPTTNASYLEAVFALSNDSLIAIDTRYEHIYLTSPRFPSLGVPLPPQRRLVDMCHPDDLADLRAMLTHAITHTVEQAGPVQVRLAASDGGWAHV